MRAAILLVSTLAVASPAWAQYQASTIRVSRDAHDLAWAATGSAITFTLKEVGLRPRYSALLGGLGTVVISNTIKCAKWCGRADINWPAHVAFKDAAYDLVLTNASLPILIGKQKGWKAGVLTGAAWVGAVLVLRQAKWNSP